MPNNSTPQFLESAMFGGSGGKFFNDLPAQSCYGLSKMKLKSILIKSETYVNQIQFILSDNFESLIFPRHGGNGGTESIFTVEDNEYITAVEIGSNIYVNSLAFFTNRGRRSITFGSDGSNLLEIVRAPPGGQLIGIKGKVDEIIDSISFIWMIRH